MDCIAIDDEPLALNLIEDFIRKVPFLHLVKRCSSAIEALQVLQETKVDLVFLDIQMPHLTGIQFMNSIQHSSMVIFTTAYDNYAVEGFDLDAVDYLLKPILFERFIKAVNKAHELYELKARSNSIPEDKDDFIFIKSDYKMLKISLKDILYLEGLKDYLKIYVENTPKPILTLQSLKMFEERLPSRDFIRVHRSFIVSLKKINFIHRNRVVIRNTEIPIGESYNEQFFKVVYKKNI